MTLMSLRKLPALLLTLLLAVVVSSCAWQLRGSNGEHPAIAAAYSLVAIEGTDDKFFIAELERSLAQSGATVLTEAPATLSIESLKINRRTKTVDAEGRTAEYDLIAELRANISHDMYSDQSLQVSMTDRYTNNINKVMASSLESQVQEKQLKQKLAERLVEKIAYLQPRTDSEP